MRPPRLGQRARDWRRLGMGLLVCDGIALRDHAWAALVALIVAQMGTATIARSMRREGRP